MMHYLYHYYSFVCQRIYGIPFFPLVRLICQKLNQVLLLYLKLGGLWRNDFVKIYFSFYLSKLVPHSELCGGQYFGFGTILVQTTLYIFLFFDKENLHSKISVIMVKKESLMNHNHQVNLHYRTTNNLQKKRKQTTPCTPSVLL